MGSLASGNPRSLANVIPRVGARQEIELGNDREEVQKRSKVTRRYSLNEFERAQ